jgi:hypothetical protein
MFKNAKKVAAVTTPAKGKAAKITDTINGLAEVAALDACAKAIKGLLDARKASLKDAAQAILIERGLHCHHRPDALSLVEGAHATGTASMRRHATTSPLSVET